MTDSLHPGERPWVYPLLYAGFAILSMLPLPTEIPYPLQNTPDVIASLLAVADAPYGALAPFFHIATLLLAGLILRQPRE